MEGLATDATPLKPLLSSQNNLTIPIAGYTKKPNQGRL